MSISSRFPVAQNIAMHLHNQLDTLESGKDGSEAFEKIVCKNMDDLSKEVQVLEGLALLEGPRKDMWKKRVSQLSDESAAFRQSLDRYLKRIHLRRRDERIREELMGSASNTSHHRNKINYLTEEKDALKRSHGVIDGVLEAGKHALESLGNQRERMKGIQRAVRNISSSLGLSSSLIGVTQRAERTNAWLTYFCMFLVIVLLVFLYYFKFIRKVATITGTGIPEAIPYTTPATF